MVNSSQIDNADFVDSERQICYFVAVLSYPKLFAVSVGLPRFAWDFLGASGVLLSSPNNCWQS